MSAEPNIAPSKLSYGSIISGLFSVINWQRASHMRYGNALRLTMLACVLSLPAGAGYTQYFTWHQKPDDASMRRCIDEMRLIVNARKSILAGLEAEGAPVITAQSLELNGIGDDGHEPFIFPGDTESTPRFPKTPPGFNFCKTAGKPYDQVVTACLLVARDHFPKSVLAIGSDGSWIDGDWGDGASLYSKVLRRPARNPIDGEVTPGVPSHGSESNAVSVPPQGLIAISLGVAVVFFLVRKVWA